MASNTSANSTASASASQNLAARATANLAAITAAAASSSSSAVGLNGCGSGVEIGSLSSGSSAFDNATAFAFANPAYLQAAGQAAAWPTGVDFRYFFFLNLL